MRGRIGIIFIALTLSCCSSLSDEAKYPPTQLEQFESLRARGSLRVTDTTSGSSQIIDVALFAREPDQVVIKGFQPMVPHFFTLLCSGEWFNFYLPRQDTVYEGKMQALDEALYEILIHPETLAQAFLPSKRNAPNIAELIVDPESGELREFKTYNTDGFLRAHVELANYESLGAVSYPTLIEIHHPISHKRILINLERIVFNSIIEDEKFIPVYPAESKRVVIT